MGVVRRGLRSSGLWIGSWNKWKWELAKGERLDRFIAGAGMGRWNAQADAEGLTCECIGPE